MAVATFDTLKFAVVQVNFKELVTKDDLAKGPIGKTMVNPGLRAYCLSQNKGWLGVSFVLLPDEETAKQVERQFIARHGLTKSGGSLFNQRMSG